MSRRDIWASTGYPADRRRRERFARAGAVPLRGAGGTIIGRASAASDVRLSSTSCRSPAALHISYVRRPDLGRSAGFTRIPYCPARSLQLVDIRSCQPRHGRRYLSFYYRECFLLAFQDHQQLFPFLSGLLDVHKYDTPFHF